MPGMTEKETCQFLLTKSTDDGITWSEAINMTKIKKPEWRKEKHIVLLKSQFEE